LYESGEWEVDLARRELRARGIPVPIGGRAFEIIEVLVQSPGELVTKDDVMGRVWPGAIVEENTLQVHISAIRKALGSDRGLLRTVSGRGYRLLGNWVAKPEDIATDAVDSGQSQTLAETFPSNLPAPGSELIGRIAAVQYLRDALSAYRAVTLTGPGGIGKTRLALEVARGRPPGHGSAGCLVEMGSLADPNLVPSAVAGVLGLKLGGDEISAESVARAIGGNKLLLVLDNCEHIVDAVASFTETVVRMCPRTTVLVTSRELLRIEGEYVYRVPPLELPASDPEEAGNVPRQSAVQLFLARTQALHVDFSSDPENIPAIAAICRRLDGIPLAIEFAAARAATLGLREVASRLDDRFQLLTSGRRTALPRHQTLRATLDWSYELLAEREQCLLRHLAIFAAGFTLRAATAIVSHNATVALTAVEGIANLVAKSLVIPDGPVSTGRWRLLETIRAYAIEKLTESGEAELAARRHAEFFRDLFAPAATASRLRPSIENMDRQVQELDNVRAALDWSFSPAGDPAVGVVLAAAYTPVWIHFELMVECRERAERALECLGPGVDLTAPLRMQLHIGLGLALIFTMGSVARARIALANALEIAESLDDIDAQLWNLWAMWGLSLNIGECREAQSSAERFSRVAPRTGDLADMLVADRLMGAALLYGGKLQEARFRFERVLEHYVAPRDRRHRILFHSDQRMLARAMLARVLWLQGFADQARGTALAGVDDAQASGYELSLCWVLYYAVYPISLTTGDPVAAERAVTMLVRLATRHNVAFWKAVARCLEAKLLIKRGEIANGSALLRAALETCGTNGWTICYPEFLGVLAESLATLGKLTEALVTIDQALATADHGGERWYVAELLRIKGELLIQQPGARSISAGEACFFEAREVARQHDALFLELRVALSLARLMASQNRPDNARQVLKPVYDRFTEGFDTPDLRAANALLESLPSSR
jgi:predicted ATPase/DNA-binding winged helix-turn-helix (wHTH) protein